VRQATDKVTPVRPAADAVTSEEGKDAVAKVLPRFAFFGALPPSVLPVLLGVRKRLDVHKNVDRKLLRLTYYLIQLACGDGSAGTPMPFSTLNGARRRPPPWRPGLGSRTPACLQSAGGRGMWSLGRVRATRPSSRGQAPRTVAVVNAGPRPPPDNDRCAAAAQPRRRRCA
jgi:hypothetical protein